MIDAVTPLPYDFAWGGFPPFLPDLALMPTWTAEQTWRGWIVRRTEEVNGHWWLVLVTPCTEGPPDATEKKARALAAALNRIYGPRRTP